MIATVLFGAFGVLSITQDGAWDPIAAVILLVLMVWVARSAFRMFAGLQGSYVDEVLEGAGYFVVVSGGVRSVVPFEQVDLIFVKGSIPQGVIVLLGEPHSFGKEFMFEPRVWLPGYSRFARALWERVGDSVAGSDTLA